MYSMYSKEYVHLANLLKLNKHFEINTFRRVFLQYYFALQLQDFTCNSCGSGFIEETVGGGADDMDGGEAAAAFMMEEAFQVREKKINSI